MSGEQPAHWTKRLRVLVNLNLIRKLGPACLNTETLPNAKEARLIQLALKSNNSLHEKTTLESDNLLDASHGPSPIPDQGTVDKATLEVQFQHSSTPHRVTLQHPDTVTVQFPEDAPTILAWLHHMGLTASKQAITALLLALATALAPAMSDNDGDDDDPDSDRYSFTI